jgi:glutaminase-like protein
MRPLEEAEVLTVAALRESEDDAAVECLFNERQQIYTVSRAKSALPVESRLREALDRNQPLNVALNPRRGVVQKVAFLSDQELREFERKRTFLERPDKPVRIELDRIDPTTFNIVDHYLKFPCFRLCTNIVPSYAVAKSIFDFCAAQSCHLPGPPAISYCIPFQFVRDGCYARAHKMRQIIEDQYGYCCEKVFSFANQGNDRLWVRADKWGGCCVRWWYHVAPLVRVRVRVRLRFPPSARFAIELVLAMVIDPSMFDKPVLLSTWLTAQENTGCGDNAHLSTYSIQPGSAYEPANYEATSFRTDPNYVDTHDTLTDYRNYTTCNGWVPELPM